MFEELYVSAGYILFTDSEGSIYQYAPEWPSVKEVR